MLKFGSNPSTIRTANKKLIIYKIRAGGGMSRTELANELKLSNTAITKIVDDLSQKGVLIEMGLESKELGRPRTILRINNNLGVVAAVNLSSTTVAICICDLMGNILYQKTLDKIIFISKDTFYKIISLIKSMMKQEGLRDKNLLSVCIGTPGRLDPVTGQYRHVVRVENYREINLVDMFKKELNVSVTVKNDINLALEFERLLRKSHDSMTDMMLVHVDFGIGAAFVLNGKLYEGKSGFAGEIGYQILNIKDTVCNEFMDLSGYNTLDGEVTLFAIRNYVIKALSKGFKSILTGWVADYDEITVDMIISAFNQGDELCSSLILHSARLLAGYIRNIAELLDLQMIIIGGLIMQCGERYINCIKDYLSRSMNNDGVDVEYSQVNEHATLYGAINEAINVAIDNIINKNT